jgi:hypothetical protein
MCSEARELQRQYAPVGKREWRREDAADSDGDWLGASDAEASVAYIS